MIVDALVAYRLTRLVTTDELTARARARLAGRLIDGGHPRLAYLLSCSYCVSVWIAAGVALVPLPRRLRYALALAGVVAIVEDLREMLAPQTLRELEEIHDSYRRPGESADRVG